MRDHSKLEAFHLADAAVLLVYRATRNFPADERFGLVAQLRRSAVSVAANIVEGAARATERDYVHFLSMAYASAKELQYELSLSRRLGFFSPASSSSVEDQVGRTARALWALISSYKSRHSRSP